MYLAIALSNMSDNKILYYDGKEIAINPANLDKITKNPEKYMILVEEKTASQDLYLKEIIVLFGGQPSESFYDNLKDASSLIKNLFINMPLVFKEIKKEDNFLLLDEKYFDIRSLFLKFDTNDFETLFKELPKLFDNDYKKTIGYLSELNNYKNKLKLFISNLSDKIKLIFDRNYKGTLNGCLKSWNLNHESKMYVLDGLNNNIYTQLKNLSYNDTEVVNQLSYAIIGYVVSDWTNDNSNLLLDSLTSFRDCIEQYSFNEGKGLETVNVSFNNVEISPLGSSFKNNIDSIIDEYSDSISNEEKAYILMEVVKKMTGGK